MLITVRKVDDKLHVTSPYSSTFVAKARKLGGKWDNDAKAWVFDALAEGPLRETLIDCYGTDGSPEQQIALKIKAKGELSEWRGAVTFGGIPVATAWGRDSGAKVCDGVILSSGKITSGGSVANWRTYVSDGAEFILTSIPKSIFERKERWAEYWDAEEISKPDKKAKEELKEELTRLEARIAEIKKELEALDA